MLNTILEIALQGLTELGPAAIAILVFCHMYYELRMKIMKAKQAKIDRNVICLENDTLKRMNKIRSESEKRLEKLDLLIQNNDAINDDNFLYLREVLQAIISQNQANLKDVWQAIEEIAEILGCEVEKQ
jgi:pyruvate/2-oxoacid:ferredoxin oxidoreductase beta subunit